MQFWRDEVLTLYVWYCIYYFLGPQPWEMQQNENHVSTGYKRLCYINWFNYKIMIRSSINKITF